jgi:hypothetical protein
MAHFIGSVCSGLRQQANGKGGRGTFAAEENATNKGEE